MKRGFPGPKPGIICCAAGAVILLALILPASFWWFALGAALSGVGIIIIVKR
ncbi:MAG: hypothetical protein IKR21_03375 [Oscillospiraceae bacterium]|nr:hypothetical protein [Oscillospiraceae bacterium]